MRDVNPSLLLVIIVGAVFCSGCAKIAEPQPPEIRVPKPAADLAAHQRSDYVVLTVTVPNRNTDGSEAPRIGSLEVYRLAENATQNLDQASLPEEQFLKRAAPILSIPAARLSDYLQENLLVIEDKFLPRGPERYSNAFRYAVIFLNHRNRTAGFSNQAFIALLPIPLPPPEVAAEVMESFIKLTWTPPSENMDGSRPARIAGYKVYRSEKPDRFPASPISTNFGQDTVFEDRNFQFGKTYYYAISVVGSRQNPYAESRLSKGVSVTPQDVFPPLPPKHFSAILDGETALLLWTSSPSPDVEGYRIYRHEQSVTGAEPLQAELITSLSFRDTGVKPDRKYEYSIVAVDRHGNESSAIRTELETR